MASPLFYVSTSFWLLYTYTFVDMDLLSLSLSLVTMALLIYSFTLCLSQSFPWAALHLLLTITNSCALVVGG
jgi:hypothetical protein